MKLEQLETFLAVVQRGSFAAAGRALHQSPSVLSRRLAALEAELGVVLLQRTTRRLSLTEAGQELLERSAPAVATLQAVAEELRAADAALQGAVRLAVPGALGRHLIAPAVFRFAVEHPAVMVDLRISDARLDLVGEGIDLAIRVGRPRAGHFAVRLLGRSPQCIVASAAYCAQHGTPTTLAALGQHRRVLRREGGQVADVPDPRPVPPALICDDVETAARAIAAGVGVGILPRWLVRDWPALCVLPIELPVPPASIVAILPGGRRPPRRVRLLLDRLAEGIAQRLV